MDIKNCPKIDTGDGNTLGSPTSDGCLIYRVVNPAERGSLMTGQLIDPTQLPPNVGLTYTYAGYGVYNAAIESCCRINTLQVFSDADRHINNPNTPYRLGTVVDIGLSNSGPSLAVPAVVTCPIDGVCQFEVHAIDDQAVENFWLASSTEASPDGSFVQPTGASIEPVTGTFQWDTHGMPAAAPGESHNYSTQVIVDDGMAESSAELWIRLVPEDTSEPPVIGPPIPIPPPPIGDPLPPDDDPDAVPPQDFPPVCETRRIFGLGSAQKFKVSASDPNSDDAVTLDVTGLPSGAEMDPELPLTGNPVESDFYWVPLEVGDFLINFSAVSGSTTVQCPVEIEVVNVFAPDFEVVSTNFFADSWPPSSRPAFWIVRPVALIRNSGTIRSNALVEFTFTRPERPHHKHRFTQRIWLDPGEQQFVRPFPAEFRISHEGTYEYRVTVDPNDTVIEIDEGNNTMSKLWLVLIR